MQVALLRAERPAELGAVEIATVDGFQGREKEAIIISAVRSNPTSEVRCWTWAAGDRTHLTRQYADSSAVQPLSMCLLSTWGCKQRCRGLQQYGKCRANACHDGWAAVPCS